MQYLHNWTIFEGLHADVLMHYLHNNSTARRQLFLT